MPSTPPTDPVEIGPALQETFPELGRTTVRRVLGTGFNSIAVETEAGIVFRVAKTEGTGQRYAMERRLLAVLRPRLPVAVPEPRWFAERAPQFPFGVIGYPKLAGRSLMPELLHDGNTDRLATQVADVLLALHRVPAEEFRPLALPGWDDQPAHYRSLRETTLPALRERMVENEFERIERWWESFLSDERLLRYRPALCHGDFWFANMLVDESAERLVGIVDWEHAVVGDPALDFSTVLHLGEDFTARVIGAYRNAGGTFDEEDSYRMRRLWELRHFYGVLFGVRFRDEPELQDSIRKLRSGPIFDEP